MNFDIFIPCAPKDICKLPFVIDSIWENIREFNHIYICTPEPASCNNFPTCRIVSDRQTLDVDRSKWKYRPNWNFQQHVKLFQQVTSDWYLTLDADVIINRPIKFWLDEKPVWYRGYDQYNQPYFNYNSAMLGLSRASNHTFIADMNLFHRPTILEMLASRGLTIGTFIAKSQLITTKDCYIAEPELYGNYWFKFHPNMYIERQLVQSMEGRVQKTNKDVWSAQDIGKYIQKCRDQNIDTINLHSWFIEKES